MSCFANKMDPHVFPKTGPYFEGWYLRIIDHKQNISLGFMFGRVLPVALPSGDVGNMCQVPMSQPSSAECRKVMLEKQTFSSGNKFINSTGSPHFVFLGLLLSLEPGGKLDNPAGYFTPDQYNMTINGKPVVKDPDDKSPANFELHISKNFSFVVDPQGTKFNLMLGEHVLQGMTTKPVPWGPGGEGPESWLENLPLPFHWFVYSLKSTVTSYKYVNRETGQTVNGSSSQDALIVAHMEKNWGKGFPKAWIWSQGINPRNGVTYVFSAGLVTLIGEDVKAQLSGYRNPEKNISCSFNPANSIHSLHWDGCAGKVRLKVEGLDFTVIYQVSAPPETFSFCLDAPMDVGFTKSCVESFAGEAKIFVYQRHCLSMMLTDSQIVHLSALEFGKAYMCNGQCTVG